MPAACGWGRRSRLVEAGRRGFFACLGLRDVMVTSIKKGDVVHKEATSAGGRDCQTISQTGTRRNAPPMMSPRAPGTMLTSGHKAPLSLRSPRLVAPLAPYSTDAAA